jgi:citrate synthase
MEPWRTAITTFDEKHIWLKGYDISRLMTSYTFGGTIFLLFKERLPSTQERQLMDAILTACTDHGPGSPSAAAARLAASGNRESYSAAIAAGILAIGDVHGGAGEACMKMIAQGIELARRESIPIQEAARQTLAESRSRGKRLPGLGHRAHSTDPRAKVIFELARENNLAGEGVTFLQALQDLASEHIMALPINVDGAIAAVLFDLGFPPPAGKLLFIIGRVAGLAAEVLEEYTREKPMRIKIPVIYDGPAPRESE